MRPDHVEGWPPDTGLGGSIGMLDSPEALIAIGVLVATAIVRFVPPRRDLRLRSGDGVTTRS